jgi:hypothetical protein
MCLHETQLVLTWDKNAKAYVGEGYKNLPKEKVGRLGRWQEAIGNSSGYGKPEELRSRFQTTDTSKVYHPGFHIFLNEQDAREYKYGKLSNEIVKVKFKVVLAFGTNEVNYKSGVGMAYGPCVIAQYMKPVEILS